MDEICGLSLLKITDLVLEPERLGAGTRRQVQQSRGVEHLWVRRKPLHEVRVKSFLQHAESQPATDVGTKGARDPRVDMPAQRETAAPESRVAAGAMRHSRARIGEPAELG